MRSPNLRYGNPAELAYYTQGMPVAAIAAQLMRDERTVRDWLSGRRKIPFWVPELLRLRHETAVARAYEMAGSVLDEQLRRRLERSDVVARARSSDRASPRERVPVALAAGRPVAAAQAVPRDAPLVAKTSDARPPGPPGGPPTDRRDAVDPKDALETGSPPGRAWRPAAALQA